MKQINFESHLVGREHATAMLEDVGDPRNVRNQKKDWQKIGETV